MDNLKKFLSHLSDNVIITDYNFNILWVKGKDEVFSQYNNCSELFKNEQLPLKDGKYYINHSGMLYECNIMNIPDCEDGVYVIQTSGDEVMYSFLNSFGSKEVIVNQIGALRDAVSGISFSNENLRKKLNFNGMHEEVKYIDIIHGNSCKVLRSAANMIELIHYADGDFEKRKIDFSYFLKKIISESQKVLNEKIFIKYDIEDNLYISSDEDRLLSFILSAVVLANGGKKENNAVKISAVRKDDFISLTITPDRLGIDEADQRFSKHEDLYSGDIFNTDWLVVNRFCKVFGGTLFVTEIDDDHRGFSFRLPYDTSGERVLTVKSNKNCYSDNLFSKYHIMYADIIY